MSRYSWQKKSGHRERAVRPITREEAQKMTAAFSSHEQRISLAASRLVITRRAK